MQMTSLKIKFITKFIGYREKQSPSNRKQTDYAAEVLKIKNLTQNLSLKFRNSRSQMFFKVGVLKNIANFTAKHLCWSLF